MELFCKVHLRAKHGVILEREVIVAYPGWLVLAASARALVGRRERWIAAQFGGRALIIIERSRPRRPHRHPPATEIVDPAEAAAERTAGVGLHQPVGRGEEGRAVILGEKIGFDGGTPEGGRR